MILQGILIKLREYMRTASSTEQGILRYLLKNPEDILTHTIHELAAATFTSSATILRLCKKLGYNGYKDFRLAISSELAIRRKSLEEEKKEITRYDTLQEIVEKTTYKNIISLEDSQHLVDYTTLKNAVDLISSCSTMVFFGIGSSLHVARDAYMKFQRISKPCIVNSDWHTQLVQSKNMTKHDLGLVFSYSGQTLEMVECMKEMRNNGVPIITITRYGVSPVTELSDCKLYVAANESLFRSGAMSSRISQLNMVDILYTAYASNNYDYSMERLSKTHIRKTEVK